MKYNLQDIQLPSGYASETLINGNVSECIRYLNELIEAGYFTPAHEELVIIKDECPDRYEYIKSKVKFHFGKY